MINRNLINRKGKGKLQVFRNKVVLLLAGSDTLQNLAIWTRNMAILYFIMEKSGGNPIAVSLIMVLEYLPIFVFSIIGGALADRWKPKRTMIIGDLLSTASIVLIILILNSGFWPILYAATFVSSVVSQFSQPSSLKIVKRNVPEEHMRTAIAITQSLQSLFLIVGPIIGTFIYTVLGIEASLYTLIVLFLLSPILLSFLPKDQEPEAKDESLFTDIKEGWKYVYQSASLKWITLVFGLVGLSLGLINPLEIFIITERLGMEQTYLQYLTGISGVGLLIGGGVAAAVSGKLNQNVTLVVCLIFFAVAILGEVLSLWFWLTLTMSFLGSVAMSFINVIISTFLVNNIEEEMVGRVNGSITPIFMASMLIGSTSAGVMMSLTSLFAVFALSALILVLSIMPGLKVQFQSSSIKASPKVQS